MRIPFVLSLFSGIIVCFYYQVFISFHFVCHVCYSELGETIFFPQRARTLEKLSSLLPSSCWRAAQNFLPFCCCEMKTQNAEKRSKTRGEWNLLNLRAVQQWLTEEGILKMEKHRQVLSKVKYINNNFFFFFFLNWFTDSSLTAPR